MLLKAGNIMYQGFAADAIPFYESLGAPVPSQENPADHFMVSADRSGFSPLPLCPALPPRLCPSTGKGKAWRLPERPRLAGRHVVTRVL